jgi:hypothetical protein
MNPSTEEKAKGIVVVSVDIELRILRVASF